MFAEMLTLPSALVKGDRVFAFNNLPPAFWPSVSNSFLGKSACQFLSNSSETGELGGAICIQRHKSWIAVTCNCFGSLVNVVQYLISVAE